MLGRLRESGIRMPRRRWWRFVEYRYAARFTPSGHLGHPGNVQPTLSEVDREALRQQPGSRARDPCTGSSSSPSAPGTPRRSVRIARPTRGTARRHSTEGAVPTRLGHRYSVEHLVVGGVVDRVENERGLAARPLLPAQHAVDVVVVLRRPDQLGGH